MQLESFPSFLQHLQATVGRVVFGAEEHTRFAMIAWMVRGHVLLEGPPGVAKTLFVRTLAQCLGLQTRRLQCTPDLMPGDVLGANIFDFRTQTFHLTKGPVFTDFLLADEINRTPPKTQSALLEAMQERSVTIDGTTHKLPDFFQVMATQNPLEHEGTYPLPEAQLDRFLFKLNISYPPPQAELQAIMAHCHGGGMPDPQKLGIQPMLPQEELLQLLEIPSQIRVEESIGRYVVDLARATRENAALSFGISPRAATMLVAASRAYAACEGRSYIVPDDIKALFLPVTRHRVALAATAEMEGLRLEDTLREILQSVPVPR
jgi:MoxR-like ATPase